MRRKQDRHAVLLRKRQEQVEQVVARDWVETGGRLVEDQELCAVAHGQRELVFDLHALGKLARALVLAQAEAFEAAAVHFFVPCGIKPARGVGDLAQALARVIAQAARDEANAPADLLLVAIHVLSEQRDPAGVGMHQMQQGLERGRLARAVAADEAHDGAGLH